MSASTEKKNRQAARDAGTDKKTNAALEEAAKKAKSKRKWTIGTIAVVVAVIAILFFSSNLFYNSLTAVDIDGVKYNRADVSYNMAAEYFNFMNSDYGQYASVFGLDSSKGIAGLKSQECGLTGTGTWQDYFIDLGIEQMKTVKALTDYAHAQGITLDAAEIAAVDSQIEAYKQQAIASGYQNFKQFLALNYGESVTEKVMREKELEATLASKAAQAYTDAQQYTAEQLEQEYQSIAASYDTYSFTYVNVPVAMADGAAEPDELAIKEAEHIANEIRDAYTADTADYDSTEEKLTAAAASVDGTLTAYYQSGVAGADLGSAAEWMQDASRREGDIEVIANDLYGAVSSYLVVIYGDHSDNHYNLANVRHILVMAQANENGEYTDEAIAAAAARAQEIYDEWLAGDKTEESFAGLAILHSEDGGSAANGGLYENIAKGQMVAPFEEFCFAGHKSGDTDIVTVRSTNYAGAHIIYYVGDGEQYSDVIARNELINTAYSEWIQSLTAGMTATKSAGLKFIA